MVIQARAWLASYDRSSVPADVVAGVTLAAYVLPAAIGDASLAGLPPQAGLYACLFGGLVFWLFCSSRVTAISVTSAISLLIGATLSTMDGGDAARHAALATCTALMVAGLALAAYLFRAGVVVNFFSETVLVGFKFGVACVLASTQLPKLFGFAGSHGDFFDAMAHFLRSLGQTNATSLALGAGALAILIAGKTLFKNRPVALVVLVGSIVAAGVLHLDRYGVKLIGDVPRGLPMPSLPAVSRADINALLPLAMACFLLAAVETSAIGRMFAAKHRYRLDASQEFLAVGASNLLSGLFAGFPISGGTSQSLVNDSAGARSPLSGLVSAAVIVVVAMFLTDLLHDLPQPVLAAIVLAAVTGLVDVHKLREIWNFDRSEFVVTAVAIIGVLGSGLLNGVLFGVGLSILLLIRRAATPRVTEVARVPGTSYFADIVRHPENQRAPGVLAVRPEGSILYFNVDHVRDRVAQLIAASATPPRVVILVLVGVPFIDLAGSELVIELRSALERNGIMLRLAEARDTVCDALKRAGAERTIDFGTAKLSVAEVVATLGTVPA
ncbi:MAG TPA: SulP family inorganic anion transporter [Vicinamibacterales bacterium]|nr:SulP family inorganic anion transporter [Vicinamibacterales bacterium]